MDKEPPRNGYRGLGADVGVGSGGTGTDRCVSCYFNGVQSDGWLSPGGGAGYRDDCRNCTPSSRYAADVRQGLSLVHVVACKSWDLPLECPPCQDHGVGQWPGNITHGRPSGGWNYIDPLNWITRRIDLRNALPVEATVAAAQAIHSAG